MNDTRAISGGKNYRNATIAPNGNPDGLLQFWNQSKQSTPACRAAPELVGRFGHVRAGTRALPCIVFDAPKASKLTALQFTIDNGFGAR